ncbi:MAG: CBS domain-containing protein [Elusimicrobia bacterium]|nr:CBS domain-containing protein [Elusimicrobiota bacterium]
MQVKEMMNKNPVCCLPDTSVREIAEMMVEHDCGSVPVVENGETNKPLLGIVTDRDIVCRLVAAGKNPLDAVVKECMTTPAVQVTPQDSIEDAARIMEENQIRRIPVVDDTGAVCGILTQAHIAKNSSKARAGELLQSISKKTGTPSAVGAHR